MIQAKEQDIAYRKQYMSDSLPTYYDESPEANAIMQANATEAEFKRAQAEDLLNQLFVSTATWGLDYWDSVLALSPAPRMLIDKRRERILVKLRGSAPATIDNLLKILNAFAQNNDAEIIEYNEEYRFEAYFPAHDGFTINLADVYHAINEVKPAHLEFLINIIVKGIVILRGKGYHFDVPFRITNCFKTAEVAGALSRSVVNIEERAYAFSIGYPITNILYPEGNDVRAKSVVALQVNTAVYYQFFERVGEVNTGEVTL